MCHVVIEGGEPRLHFKVTGSSEDVTLQVSVPVPSARRHGSLAFRCRSQTHVAPSGSFGRGAGFASLSGGQHSLHLLASLPFRF